jgi:hypothetical protein
MRRLVAAVMLAAALAAAGCNASGETASTRTFSDKAVPFTFTVPADFTDESIDQGNSRGDVIAAAGLTKVDVIAVRRIDDHLLPIGGPGRPVAHEVLGHAVKSDLRPVPGFPGWFLECQYTAERASKVVDACGRAVGSVRRR